ncbi:2OG-Fe(II) oxygenase [Pseudomonadales bacterium]|nr:2OG-Fe(II) oxygenase [Pseudomonadales bacterium]
MSENKQQYLKSCAVLCANKIVGSSANNEYFTAPYKHLVIDDFLPSELADYCLKHFPPLDDAIWQHENDLDVEVKSRTIWKSEFDIPVGIIDVVRLLNSAPILNAISQRFGIPKIIPDPYFTGGGLNVTSRGGLLDVHVDGNYHDKMGLTRRFNAILYLNPGWQEDWGGEFGIYNDSGDICVKKVAPLFNRLIIFHTHDYSYHGLPDPINFPSEEFRRSVILYYYTKQERPPEESSVQKPHSALWKKRAMTDKRGNKTRDFD